MAVKQTIIRNTKTTVRVPKSSLNKRGSNKCPVCGKFMSTGKSKKS